MNAKIICGTTNANIKINNYNIKITNTNAKINNNSKEIVKYGMYIIIKQCLQIKMHERKICHYLILFINLNLMSQLKEIKNFIS